MMPAPPPQPFDAARLVHPYTPEAFLASYFERTYLHIRREQPDYYNAVLSVDDLDAHLQNQMLYYPHVQVARDGAYIGIEHWQAEGREVLAWNASNERLFGLMHEGCTLILGSAQKAIPKLAAFCNRLDVEWRMRVNANVYLTPANAQGFDRHFDTHDVLVLQISGSKDWTIYEALDELPVERNTQTETREEPELVETLTLRAGDLLYIPRGVYHKAKTGAEASVHITLALYPCHAFDLVDGIAQAAKARAVFRRSIPHPASTPDQIAAFKETFVEELRALVDRVDVDALLAEAHTNQLRAAAPRLDHRLKDMLALPAIDLDTQVQRRADLPIEMQAEGTRIHLRYGRKRQTYPRFMAPVLKHMLQPESFAVRELPSPLDDESKIDLVQTYVRTGVLQIVD